MELFIENNFFRFFWTSGRKCDFDGCDREDLQPTILNGQYNSSHFFF